MLTDQQSRTESSVTEARVVLPGALPRRPLDERIDVRVAIAIGVAWFVLPTVAVALEPAPQGAEPAFATVLGVLMDALFIVMLAGLALRRRWGLVTSLVGAVFLTALAVACPTSGHHGFGAWWFGEMACVLALVAGSVVALRWPAATDAADAVGGADADGAEPQRS